MKRQKAGVLRRSILLATVVLAASLAAVGTAQAITGGQPDGNGHPNVGLMVVDFGSGSQPWCSGTLIAPTYFLTAAHCIAPLQQFGGTVTGVTFDPKPDITARRSSQLWPRPWTLPSGTIRATCMTLP
jgi:secreted trypsin-like serine protease